MAFWHGWHELGEIVSDILDIQLCGAPRFTWNGDQPISIAGGKSMALLVYLVATRQSHGRDLLANLLWSELSNQQARDNLRYTLPALRKQLAAYLAISVQAIRFNQTLPYRLDLEIIQQTITQPAPGLTTSVLQAAINLYQDELLAGFHVRNAPLFEAWVVRQREELHRLVVHGLQLLAERYLVQGDISSGLTATQRLLTLDPLHETGHQLQMKLLVATGQRSAAITHYHQLLTQLVNELGIDPAEETYNLYMQILEGKLEQRDAGVIEVRVPSATPAIADTHNLPTQLTPFVGRQQEVADLCTQLRQSKDRLITLVGEGGAGKTRLALAVAQAMLDEDRLAQVTPGSTMYQRKFPDGLWFVPLTSITAGSTLADSLAIAVAQVLGLQFSGSHSLPAQLLLQLRHKVLLLLFDNAEHLLPEITTFLLQLLKACPHIKVLVTSRHVLNLQAEVVWSVAGLPIPRRVHGDTGSMMDYSSVALFVERARQSNRHFQVSSTNAAAIGAICRLVDGLPLAIELAAALTRHYTCAEIYNTLQRDYTILATSFTDLPPQHRSMQAVLDYSWRFLTEAEARLLAACSIFVGSFTHQAAAAATGIEMSRLHRLVDQSLLHVRDGRFAMHGLVRQYAAAHLTHSPQQQIRTAAAHARYYIERLHSLAGALVSDFAAQQHVWDEVENIRSAWQWSVCHESLALLEQGLESLYSFYRLTGMYREAIQLFEFALQRVRRLVADRPADPQPRRLLTRLLAHIAEFYRRTDNLARGEALAEEALIVAQCLQDSALQGLAYHRLARLAYTRSNFSAMRDLAEAGYQQAQRTNDTHLVAECLNDWGIAVSSCTGPLAALPHFQQALTLLQGGTNRVLEAFVLINLGFFSFAAGQYQAAYTFLHQGLTLQRLLQDRGGRLSPLIHLGNLQSALGNYGEAQVVFDEVLALVQITGGAYWESWVQTSYGRWHHLNGDPSTARALCSSALQTAQQNGIPLQQQWALVYLGHALADVGAMDAAAQHYQQAIALHKAGSWLHRTADAHAGLAALLLAQEQITEAVAQVDAALALLDEHGLAGAAEPFALYWTAIRVLRRAEDPRAICLLHTANRALDEIAGLLEEHSLRRAFLENVAVNRLITAQIDGNNEEKSNQDEPYTDEHRA